MNRLLTARGLFVLLAMFTLLVVYNLYHFSDVYAKHTLNAKYEEKLKLQHAYIKRLKEEVAELEEKPCEAPKPTKPPPPPSPTSSPITTTKTTTTITTTPISLPPPIPVIPVLVFACNRKDYLQSTLNNLFKYRPSPNFPIVVSQGCGDDTIAQFLKDDYGDKVVALKHYKQDIGHQAGMTEKTKVYAAIARHYGWALAQIFTVMNFEAVLIVEDDLEISVDFFNYFSAMYPILRDDPSLYCVSSWNDNGMSDRVADPKAIRRTEVFPGLGWMMTKSLWNEIKNRWPINYWDEFMRLPDVRKDRSCLYPEVSRNRNIGRKGASEGQFMDKIVRNKFNEEFVNFTALDMSYLMKDRFDAELKKRVSKARGVSVTDVDKYNNEDLRVEYSNFEAFKGMAMIFNIMEDEKEGMPRTSYKGIVQFHKETNRIFLVPENYESRL